MPQSTSAKKKAVMAIAPIISAALVGASLQLVFYPQVVFGVFLLAVGTAMKLYSAWIGIVLMVMAVPCVLALVFLLHTRLQKGLPHAIATLVARLAPKIFEFIKNIPPSLIVTLAFALPALGQVNAAFSMVRMLVQVGAESSVFTISLFSTASAVLTLLVQVFGVLENAYMTPGKICFLLNTAWILKSIVVDGNTRPGGKSVFPFLTTMILGWSSLILSSLPDKAVLNASQAAMKAAMVSAAVAGGGVAVVAVVAARNEQQEQQVAQIVDGMVQEDEDVIPVQQKQEFLDNLVQWILAQVDRLKQVKAVRDAQKRVDEASDKLRVVVQETGEKVKDSVLETSDLVFAKMNEQLDPAETAVVVVVEEEEEDSTDRIALENPAVAFLKEINPPVPVAIVIAIIRAVPTLIVFLLVELIGVYHVAVKKEPTKQVFFPITLLPFVIAELFALFKRVGLKRGFTSAYRIGITGLETDGMSILLWQSPRQLAIWNQFKQADSRIGDISQAMFTSPKSLLFPSEEYIGSAPNPDRQVWMKLVGSFVIDFIGVSTFAIPGMGEAFDVVWAPISGMIIQQVYGSPGFAFMGFAEEILPFTDVLPTATIAWFWMFATEIPVWVIRVSRAVREMQQKKTKKE